LNLKFKFENLKSHFRESLLKLYISYFIASSSAADCLLDGPPLLDFAFPDELPGQLFDADEQCRFQYGAHSRQCKIGVSYDSSIPERRKRIIQHIN